MIGVTRSYETYLLEKDYKDITRLARDAQRFRRYRRGSTNKGGVVQKKGLIGKDKRKGQKIKRAVTVFYTYFILILDFVLSMTYSMFLHSLQ